MPLIKTSSYKPPVFFRNRHVNTIIHALFRKVHVTYKRERLHTPDEDFVDLDFSSCESSKVEKTKVILLLLHGLEGSAQSSYIKGMVRSANDQGWDAAALNFRGCSGEDNLRIGSYHSGKTEDIQLVVNHLKHTCAYQTIFAVGYSLGANALLKYLGETKGESQVNAAVALSVPCDLSACAGQLNKWYNRIYRHAFLRTLRKKVRLKMELFSKETINFRAAFQAKTFQEFDNEFTAPANGFKDASAYWDQSSCLPYLMQIKQPTLLINALDDPFLTPTCFPYEQSQRCSSLYLETPKNGGHLGFLTEFPNEKTSWHEKRVVDFLNKYGE